MQLFLSLQIIHIIQCGTKFQTFEERFPNQFLQLASMSITLLGRTQETPKDLRAKLHNQNTLPQCRSRWSTLPITFTKAIPIHNYAASFPQMVCCENLPPRNCPNKKRHTTWSLHTPNTLPRKSNRAWSPQCTMKGFYIKNPKHHLILSDRKSVV